MSPESKFEGSAGATPSHTSGAAQASETKSPAAHVASPNREASIEADRKGEINKELRRLNRALRALSACNKALSHAGSEQELLDQICDVIVRLGEYRLAWIGYAEQDDAKTVRAMAFAGDDAGYLQNAVVTWSEAPTGQGSIGTAIRENRTCVITDIRTDPRFAAWHDLSLIHI